MKLNKVLVLSALMALSIVPARAGFNEGCTVTLGGQPIFTITRPANGFSAEHRAWISQDRLDNALFLSADHSPSAVTVERINGAWCVMVGGRCAATADSGEATALQWADKIKGFLSDSSRAESYIANLKRPNQLGADIAIVERKLYAPAGTTLPIKITTKLDSRTAVIGERVEGIITKDVPIGNYVVPMNSVVLGELVETRPGTLAISVNTLRTPSGTIIPISAKVVDSYVIATAGPHPVCTLAIPADPYRMVRMPATIGVGAVGSPGQTQLVLERTDNRVIAAGQPFSLVIENPTPLALVVRDHAM